MSRFAKADEAVLSYRMKYRIAKPEDEAVQAVGFDVVRSVSVPVEFDVMPAPQVFPAVV